MEIRFFKDDKLNHNKIFIYLLALILITIPLDFAFGSISCIAFLVFVVFNLKKLNFTFRKQMLFPIILYSIMAASLFWTQNVNNTLSGLQKTVLFLLLPIAFCFTPKFQKKDVYKVIRWFSLSMVLYALYFYFLAIVKYFETKNRDVFFFHELVSLDINAIYMAAFASLAMFYFVGITNKNIWERAALTILVLFVFLLSSRSVFFIDLVLIIYYYIFFSKTESSVKVLTVITVVSFFIFSILYIPQLRERFLSESETAFVDNVISDKLATDKDQFNKISVEQAWSKNEFHQNNFFPGTALRVFQVRIFKEMLNEQDIFLTGFGHEASQKEIEKKIEQKKLSLGYKIFNFHNQYIQTFAELGIFGFLTLVVMLFFNLKNALKHKDFLHLVFAVTTIILFLTESMFCRQRGIVFFITLYCIFNSMNNSRELKEKP